jgi:hypothetical protein
MRAAAEGQGYISGWCGAGTGHGRCVGSYAGTSCTCQCHLAAAGAVSLPSAALVPVAA